MNHIPFSERPTCTAEEACRATGIGRSKLWKDMQEGKIAFTKVGTRRLVIVASLLEYLKPKAEIARQKEAA